LYIAPVKGNIPIDDDLSETDDDKKSNTKSNKFNKRTDEKNIIVISDNEDEEFISDNLWLQSSTSSLQDNTNIRVEDNSLSVNEFCLNILNKLHSKYNIPEGSSTRINIRSRDYICDNILNWINNAQINDLIKNPIVEIGDEE